MRHSINKMISTYTAIFAVLLSSISPYITASNVDSISTIDRLVLDPVKSPDSIKDYYSLNDFPAGNDNFFNQFTDTRGEPYSLRYLTWLPDKVINSAINSTLLNKEKFLTILKNFDDNKLSEAEAESIAYAFKVKNSCEAKKCLEKQTTPALNYWESIKHEYYYETIGEPFKVEYVDYYLRFEKFDLVFETDYDEDSNWIYTHNELFDLKNEKSDHWNFVRNWKRNVRSKFNNLKTEAGIAEDSSKKSIAASNELYEAETKREKLLKETNQAILDRNRYIAELDAAKHSVKERQIELERAESYRNLLQESTIPSLESEIVAEEIAIENLLGEIDTKQQNIETSITAIMQQHEEVLTSLNDLTLDHETIADQIYSSTEIAETIILAQIDIDALILEPVVPEIPRLPKESKLDTDPSNPHYSEIVDAINYREGIDQYWEYNAEQAEITALILDFSLLAMTAADNAYSVGEYLIGEVLKTTAFSIADLATDFTPGVSLAKDLEILRTGVNPVTKEEVSDVDRAVILATLIVPGAAKGTFKTLERVSDSAQALNKSGSGHTDLAEELVDTIKKSDDRLEQYSDIDCLRSIGTLKFAMMASGGGNNTRCKLGEITDDYLKKRAEFGSKLTAQVEKETKDIIKKGSSSSLNKQVAASRVGAPEFNIKSDLYTNIKKPTVSSFAGITMEPNSTTLYKITDVGKYMENLANLYMDSNSIVLNERMADFIQDHIGPAGSKTFSTDINIPGTHAEVLAANEVLNKLGDKFDSLPGKIQVVTYKLKPAEDQGEMFEACNNCSGILPPEFFEILTGRK